MQIMNDFKPVITESTNLASLGTAFLQGGKTKKHLKDRLTDAEWNALSPEAKSKLIEKQKAEKAAKGTVAGKTAKSSEDKKNNDDYSLGSTKSIADLQKDNVRLK